MMRDKGEFRRGDQVRAKCRMTIKELGGFPCVEIIEGIVVNVNPLVIEYDTGEGKYQVPVISEAREKIEIIKEAENG